MVQRPLDDDSFAVPDPTQPSAKETQTETGRTEQRKCRSASARARIGAEGSASRQLREDRSDRADKSSSTHVFPTLAGATAPKEVSHHNAVLRWSARTSCGARRCRGPVTAVFTIVDRPSLEARLRNAALGERRTGRETPTLHRLRRMASLRCPRHRTRNARRRVAQGTPPMPNPRQSCSPHVPESYLGRTQ